MVRMVWCGWDGVDGMVWSRWRESWKYLLPSIYRSRWVVRCFPLAEAEGSVLCTNGTEDQFVCDGDVGGKEESQNWIYVEGLRTRGCLRDEVK